MQDNTQILREKHLNYAVEVTAVVKERFPFGAVNVIENVKNQQLSDKETTRYMDAFLVLENELNQSEKNVEKILNAMAPVTFGNCGIFTSYAIGYLRNKYPNNPDTKFECVYIDNNDHALLSIGRPQNSNPKEINTWGRQTILCDILSGAIYSADEFRAIQKNSPNIPLYRRKLNSKNELLEFTQSSVHYLAGEPIVYVSSESETYDQALTKWVKQDLKLRATEITAPTVTPVKSILNDPEIVKVKNGLANITGTTSSDWKYNQKNGFICWLETPYQNLSDRVATSLKCAKVAVITHGSTTKQNTKFYIIKCEHLDTARLDKLSKSLQLHEHEQNIYEHQSQCQQQ